MISISYYQYKLLPQLAGVPLYLITFEVYFFLSFEQGVTDYSCQHLCLTIVPHFLRVRKKVDPFTVVLSCYSDKVWEIFGFSIKTAQNYLLV